MTPAEEFKINDYLSLKLEDSKTEIYIANKKFRQCKYLLLDIPVDDLSSFKQIDSVDEAAFKLNASFGAFSDSLAKIPPDTEFWGHCSNLQVWYEYDYDTRLIHRNIAFPILKKLTEAGDPLARKVFKKEIINRLQDSFLPVIWFLNDEGYFEYLTHEEMIRGLLIQEEVDTVFDIEYYLGKELEYISDFSETYDHQGFSVEDMRIKQLGLYECGLATLPDSIGTLSSLEYLDLENNQLNTLPESIGNLTKLEKLILTGNKLKTLPQSIGDLISLKKLVLKDNLLTTLPKSVGNLRNLELLVLSGNHMQYLPNSIKDLPQLKVLDLD